MSPSTVVIQVAFYVFFAIALRAYLRRPGPLTRDIVLMFGSLAGLFAFQVLRARVPALEDLLGLIGVLLVLAQPGLALRVARHIGSVPRWVDGAMALGYVALVAVLLTAGPDQPWTIWFAIGYFLVGDLGAAVVLARQAQLRQGVARWRIAAASGAVALTGIALVASLLGDVGVQASRGLGLLAVVAFVMAFAPPKWLRRTIQQAIAYRFLEDLSRAQPGSGTTHLWELLANASAGLTGALRSEVYLTGDDAPVASVVSESRDAPRVTVIPFGSEPPRGELRLSSRAAFLFADDDLKLLALLGAQTVVAADREMVLAERTAIAQRVAATNVELARASAAKSDFLAAMSHELRTPLNAIIGFSELLLTPPVPLTSDSTREYAGHIHGAGEHLLGLINDILDLSRVEAGRLELRYETVDVARLIAETVGTLRSLAEVKGLDLQVDIPDELIAELDAGRVRQVVYNVVANAIKFTPADGSVRVELTSGVGSLALLVTDDGPGIDPADHDRIFAAFEQVTPGSKEGTGLGLALTRRLVEAHEGRIELSSAPGHGSRFTVHLPLRRPFAVEGSSVEPDAGDAPLVLVIEDDSAAAELLRVQLRQAGYRAAVAVDGESGLRAARDLAPSAILLDILLPGVDGWEVLRSLRVDAATRDVPVMVISVVDHAGLGLALGAQDYFVKPISRDALLTALGRLVTVEAGRGGRPVTVLAIDDDPSAMKLYRDSLSAAGFRVTLATTGRDGLEQARAGRVDAIVLDMMLPDIDGFEVAARLKADPATRDIPILVVTGQNLDEAAKARLNEHALTLLSKGDEALDGLREWLGQLPKAA